MRSKLDFSTINQAVHGDEIAMQRVLKYYEGYIRYLCSRGNYVDEDMMQHLNLKLIKAVTSFKMHHSE